MKHKFFYFSVLILLLFFQIITCKYPSNPEIICPVADANPESLGIYSETGPMLYPDINCYIGTYHGEASTITIGPDFEEKKEGLKSLKTTLSVDRYDGYAGWFISWGNRDTFNDDSCTRNMSDYANGRLSFWMKSNHYLYLDVGIRSGDVPAGKEESTAYLRSGNYNFEADGNWHKVCIPISHFQGSYPLADLNRIKLLFFIAASWSTGGEPITFWIDDVRWEFSPCPTKSLTSN